MKEKIRAHHTPSKSGSPADGDIGIRHAQDILLHKIGDLAIKSGLQPVSNVSDNFLAEMDWLLSNGGVKKNRLLNRLG
jgi:hypothetical protein